MVLVKMASQTRPARGQSRDAGSASLAVIATIGIEFPSGLGQGAVTSRLGT